MKNFKIKCPIIVKIKKKNKDTSKRTNFGLNSLSFYFIIVKCPSPLLLSFSLKEFLEKYRMRITLLPCPCFPQIKLKHSEPIAFSYCNNENLRSTYILMDHLNTPLYFIHCMFVLNALKLSYSTSSKFYDIRK